MPVPEKRKYTCEEFLAVAEQSEMRMELIDSEIVYLASPIEIHQDIVGILYFAAINYIQRNKGKCKPMASPFDVILGDDVVQPDFMVICDRSKMNGKRCIGAPDWIVEVVSSDTQRDYVKKLAIYQEAGVREYWIIDPDKNRIFVYFFEESENVVNLYNWSDCIPVRIFQDQSEPLTLCIEELLRILP